MSSAPSGGEPQGPGACTVQGCNCPAFVGNQAGCRRQGCWHGYGYHDNSLVAKDVLPLNAAAFKASEPPAEVLKAAKASHDAAAAAKADEDGDPQGPGACTVQGCNCPRFVGNQSSCRRPGCYHGYGYHDN